MTTRLCRPLQRGSSTSTSPLICEPWQRESSIAVATILHRCSSIYRHVPRPALAHLRVFSRQGGSLARPAGRDLLNSGHCSLASSNAEAAGPPGAFPWLFAAKAVPIPKKEVHWGLSEQKCTALITTKLHHISRWRSPEAAAARSHGQIARREAPVLRCRRRRLLSLQISMNIGLQPMCNNAHLSQTC
jgi:hypothetical protein